MPLRPLVTTALLLALCTACSATGVHRKHDLRFHGGTNIPADDIVAGLTTGDADDTSWGIEYIYSQARGQIGVEAGAFQSLSKGHGTNTLPGFGLGRAEVDKQQNDLRLGLNYPLERFLGLETDLGIGLAYLDTSITTNIAGGPELKFEDQGAAAYAKAATMLPITDSFGIGLDVRYLAVLEDFEDTQQGVTFDAQLDQWQATLFIALTW